jgi:hypothetical protein
MHTTRRIASTTALLLVSLAAQPVAIAQTPSDLQKFNPAYREEKLNAAVQRAQAFAFKCIAPMTDPNSGPPCAEHATRGTPSHYALKQDSKRGFQLGLILIGGRHTDEGIKIMNASLDHFPIGNAGQDGVHAAEPSALILSGF